MRIRWRGLELPSRITRDENESTDIYGRFYIEPFEQGYGTTVGNSLRRVLLSSLEGAAVSAVKIGGVTHEFCSIEGVIEDVTDIILNIKNIVVRLEGDEPKTMSVRRDTAGEVLAGDIVTDPAIEVINQDHKIATLTADVPFHLEMTVRRGRGYAAAVENRSPEQELGVLAVDSIFSPVVRVRYRTEDMRVGQRTNYDRLIMEIWTKGTILPEDALVESAMILRKHLNPIVMYHELGETTVKTPAFNEEMIRQPTAALEELLDKPVSVLGLSVRSSNCLEAQQIKTIRQLVSLTEPQVLQFRSFGKTSLHEVQRKLADLGLRLGMFDGSGAPIEAAPADTSAMDEEESDEQEGPERIPPGSNPMEAYTMGD